MHCEPFKQLLPYEIKHIVNFLLKLLHYTGMVTWFGRYFLNGHSTVQF